MLFLGHQPLENLIAVDPLPRQERSISPFSHNLQEFTIPLRLIRGPQVMNPCCNYVNVWLVGKR